MIQMFTIAHVQYVVSYLFSFCQQSLAKGFIDVTGTFNYVVSPELSTLVCYKYSRLQVQNCAGIYHQWKNNKIRVDVRYQTRSISWSGVSYLEIRYTQGYVQEFLS